MMPLASNRGPNTSTDVNSNRVATLTPAIPRIKSNAPSARSHFHLVLGAVTCEAVVSSGMGVSPNDQGQESSRKVNPLLEHSRWKTWITPAKELPLVSGEQHHHGAGLGPISAAW